MVFTVALACLGTSWPQARAADPAPAAGDTTGVPAAPTVEEWLNQPVLLRETVRAMSQPSPGAKPLSEIRAGAEVEAVGLVAEKHWVQIELPDHSRAYVPREAIEYASNSAALVPAAGRQGASSPAAPTPASTASATAAASARAPGPTVTPVSATGAIRGKVTRVPNAATLVVGDQRVRLSGIDPGPSEVLGPFAGWVAGQGDLVCNPDAQTGRYRCLTGAGVDVAEAAILNGSGRVGDGATPEYRDSETQARQAHRGLWQGP